MAERKWKVGDRVRFGHVSKSIARTYEIQAIEPDGFLRVSGLKGKHSPHLFVRAEEGKS